MKVPFTYIMCQYSMSILRGAVKLYYRTCFCLPYQYWTLSYT